MEYTNDDYNLDENDSESQQSSNHSSQTTPLRSRKTGSNTVLRGSSSLSSTDSVFGENYSKQLTDRVLELKAELPAQRHFDWLTKFEPGKHNPKIELNLLLHGAIREETLRQLALSEGIPFNNDEKTIGHLFQNDDGLFQRIFEELVQDRRQQRIIYTEILLRPDVFTSDSKISSAKLKRMMNVIIDCIRSSTCANLAKNRAKTATESNTIIERTRMNSSTAYDINFMPVDLKLILSCNWNNVENMAQFIRFARNYPDEIVGIDFYGGEDDCRACWHRFCNYTKTLCHLRLPCQANMNNYHDLQLIDDVIKNLGIHRLCEAYSIVSSSKHMENILIKRGVHLIVCPVSSSCAIANQLINVGLLNASKRGIHQSNSSIGFNTNDHTLNETIPFHLINHLQCAGINYSITSFSPIPFKQTLSSIYESLLEENKKFFTCEDMKRANENAVKLSFASQKLKFKLMKYLHDNYIDCYEHNVLLKYSQEATHKWHEEMIETIDRNARTAAEFASKMRQDKMVKRQNDQKAMRTASVDEENEYEDAEVE